MTDICGECLNLDWNNKERYTSRDKYYCKELRKYVEPTDRSCRYYSYNRDHNTKNNNGEYTPSGCYITTIICNVLGYEDNCELLNTLRNFRDNVLKKDPQYLSLLLEYDQVGPLISNGILAESCNQSFCLGLLKYFLIPCVEYIKQNDVENAVKVYQNMVLYLNDEFNLPTININGNVEYDIETVGKGRIRTPQTSEI